MDSPHTCRLYRRMVTEALERVEVSTLQQLAVPLLAAFRAAHLRPLRWHDLRAIHGGWLVQAGVGMATARDRLGHSTIGVTSTFYSGVVDALGREVMDKVGSLLAG